MPTHLTTKLRPKCSEKITAHFAMSFAFVAAIGLQTLLKGGRKYFTNVTIYILQQFYFLHKRITLFFIRTSKF